MPDGIKNFIGITGLTGIPALLIIIYLEIQKVRESQLRFQEQVKRSLRICDPYLDNQPLSKDTQLGWKD